jgi:hypothetical protein
MEMMIPADDTQQAINDVIAFQASVQKQHNASVQLFTGVRYVLADDIPLSPFYGRDTAVFSMIVFGTSDEEANPAVGTS